MNIDAIKSALCHAFCKDISIIKTRGGFVISARYSDELGDPIECYIENISDKWYLFDNGQFIPDLIGRGIDINSKARREFLNRAMEISGAYLDEESFSIQLEASSNFPESKVILDFLTTLLKVQDLKFWNQERIKSTFREDAYLSLSVRLKGYKILRNSAIPGIEKLKDFPADIVVTNKLRPESGAVAFYLVQDISNLTEALALWLAANGVSEDVCIFALIEDASRLNMNSHKAQRAINRIDAVAIWDENPEASLDKMTKTVSRQLGWVN
ncbi:DUF1828 domain-containing protein [Gluconobacter kondonii]|uniref:DUF1828 domain-containing protein n=1 Tax=Gluconobacter kondonii TaxID=941463 RepID=UPI001B8BC3E3|nr:DUF1828 domain-containing protein [Gluconobacter kondonii]MBS1079132.1 DUF1828 domain-containing protein [Gluconobacter kondonii]